MKIINQNSDFLYLFQARLTNCNGDPDQENKPRMDYDTSTLLVSDARRKRDIRDFLKQKNFPIFVDTLADNKVSMETMFKHIRAEWLTNVDKVNEILNQNSELKDKLDYLCDEYDIKKDKLIEKLDAPSDKMKKDKKFTGFNNTLLTEIIKRSLIDIRLFGSAMAVEGVSRTFTGPIQMSWGYSLHPVELVKSNSITTIMSDDSSTFGKKYKVYYSLVAHYGTINKFSAQKTKMTEQDRDIFRKAIVQSLMSNQTDSKQGQDPFLYLEIKYIEDFDGYLGDLRRFIDVNYDDKRAIRSINDIAVDFSNLKDTIDEMKNMGYIDKVVGWKHPFVKEGKIKNLPEYEATDLWAEVKSE